MPTTAWLSPEQGILQVNGAASGYLFIFLIYFLFSSTPEMLETVL